MSKVAESWKGSRQRTGEERAGGKTGCEEEHGQVGAWMGLGEAACKPEPRISQPQWSRPCCVAPVPSARPSLPTSTTVASASSGIFSSSFRLFPR